MNKIKFIDARQANDVYRYKNKRCFNNVWLHLLVFMWYGWEFYFSQLRTFGRTVWTCIILLPNSCTAALCFTLSVWISCSRQNDSHCIASPLTTFSAMWLLFFPKFEVALMWRRINVVSVIHAKLQNAFTKCQVMHFTDCFEWLHNCWSHSISQHCLVSVIVLEK